MLVVIKGVCAGFFIPLMVLAPTLRAHNVTLTSCCKRCVCSLQPFKGIALQATHIAICMRNLMTPQRGTMRTGFGPPNLELSPMPSSNFYPSIQRTRHKLGKRLQPYRYINA